MGELSVLSDSSHGGEEVVDSGTKDTTELSLLGWILLSQDLGADVVVRGLTHEVIDESDLFKSGAVGNIHGDTSWDEGLELLKGVVPVLSDGDFEALGLQTGLGGIEALNACWLGVLSTLEVGDLGVGLNESVEGGVNK